MTRLLVGVKNLVGEPSACSFCSAFLCPRRGQGPHPAVGVGRSAGGPASAPRPITARAASFPRTSSAGRVAAPVSLEHPASHVFAGFTRSRCRPMDASLFWGPVSSNSHPSCCEVAEGSLRSWRARLSPCWRPTAPPDPGTRTARRPSICFGPTWRKSPSSGWSLADRGRPRRHGDRVVPKLEGYWSALAVVVLIRTFLSFTLEGRDRKGDGHGNAATTRHEPGQPEGAT